MVIETGASDQRVARLTSVSSTTAKISGPSIKGKSNQGCMTVRASIYHALTWVSPGCHERLYLATDHFYPGRPAGPTPDQAVAQILTMLFIVVFLLPSCRQATHNEISLQLGLRLSCPIECVFGIQECRLTSQSRRAITPDIAISVGV